METLNTTAAGFFRFPTRMMVCPVRMVRAERIDCHAARALFRHRHADAEPVKTLPVTITTITQSRVPAARITVRV